MSGISRYTSELIHGLAASRDELSINLLLAGNRSLLNTHTDMPKTDLLGCRLLPALITWGNLLVPIVARRLCLDLVHDPTGVTPFAFGAGGAKRIVTVHDVFAWSVPGTSSRLDTIIYRSWLPRILPGVNAVITVSDQSKQDIVHHLNVQSERVHVVPEGVSDRFQPLPSDLVRARLKARFDLEGRYILFVGALTLRKNVERALRAFATLCRDYPGLGFVLAGRATWKKTPIEALVRELGIASRILVTGSVTDAELHILYCGADLFVFPSLYEGFGLPPLEAMACGTPVITSNISSLPEVVGEAALLVDPYDVKALSTAMRDVLDNPELRSDLRGKGLARARQFTWERTAQQTLAVYRKVLA